MLSDKAIENVRRQYHDRPLVIEGCNGSIGLSVLEILATLKIRPSRLLLTTQQSLPNQGWSHVCEKFVSLKSAKPEFSSERKKIILDFGENINVLFCAGYGRPTNFISNPASVIEANISNLLEYEVFYNIDSFAFMSTSELYAGINGEASEESPLPTIPQHPRGVYVESKRLAEAIVYHLIGKKVRRHASFRVALATPPKLLSNDSRVLADLINKGRTSGIVSLNGGSNYIRQYQYGPNCALKILGAMACGHSTLYNNAGSHILTLGDLARLVGKILNLPVIIYENNQDLSAPSSVLINVEKINSESGYDVNHELNFEDYLRKMIGL